MTLPAEASPVRRGSRLKRKVGDVDDLTNEEPVLMKSNIGIKRARKHPEVTEPCSSDEEIDDSDRGSLYEDILDALDSQGKTPGMVIILIENKE